MGNIHFPKNYLLKRSNSNKTQYFMNQIKEIKEKSNSYLSFMLEGELFAAHVGHVNNIIEVPRITVIPDTPGFLKGVINLRGQVLPVIDIRLIFGMTRIKLTSLTCILVLDINLEGENMQVGAMVDNVHEVIEINKDQILQSPKVHGLQKANVFIEGMVKVNEQFLMILNINKIFDFNSLEEIKNHMMDLKNEVSI